MTSMIMSPVVLGSPSIKPPGDPMITTVQDSQTLRKKKAEAEDKPRGRRRIRVQKVKETGGEGSDADENRNGDEGHSSCADAPSRKRRRSRKGLDKKFECPQEGCGKSYSRAEHLYRHQLNHTPKQIYNCDFPDCNRTFVRQDLCNRHKERHTAKGSQLQRKDSSLNHVSPTGGTNKSLSLHGSASPEITRPILGGNRSQAVQLQYPSPENLSSPFSPTTAQSSTAFTGSASSSTANDLVSYQQQPTRFKRSNSDHSLAIGPGLISRPPQVNTGRGNRPSSFGVTDAKPIDTLITRPLQPTAGSYSLPPSTSSHQSYHGSQGAPSTAQSSIRSPYVNQQNLTPFALPPPSFATAIPTTSSRESDASYDISPPHSSVPVEYQRDSSQGQQSSSDMILLDQMAAPSIVTVFGGEGYNRSPFAIPDDFVAYLFSDPQFNNSSSMAPSAMAQHGYANYLDTQNQYQPYFGNDPVLCSFAPHNQQDPMSVTSLLDTSLPEMVLSEEKSQEIVDLIKERFNETDHAPVAKQKETLLEGDRTDDSHMMSRKMMQTYIGSFWWHFHPQLPILHKPTFSPEKTPNLLLIAMMAIGAACLDKMHGYKVTQAGAELSNFLAWHLRWEIFSDVHFRPPAKLWVFQALLLLEIYEKMYSTRALHERAHIHHATTITLMRRGSSLIGRSALDSPPSVRDEKQGTNGSRHSSTSGGANTPDQWWNHWITNEATRRAAFAAFVIDSTHATMFGHSTVMVAHEMRLPLPCDEALWSATNSAEVARIEASLHANGVKAISFLEGLKRTLSSQEVRTNAFGRTILMAGLLSVSWHMNQRDLQVNSLGVSQALGGRDKWRGSLTRAFDLWKQDFDRSLTHGAEGMLGPYIYSGKQEEKVVFESRTVLHHLAHMAMHVDIVDCQIFARAKRLLGRTISTQDLNGAKRKMREVWAPTAKARDATYYALRFLCIVLLPDESTSFPHNNEDPNPDPPFEYSARDDVLLNRSWVLYFAALIVWSYGYALEGPNNCPILASYAFEDQVRDMRAYLRRLENVNTPEDLKFLKGFNGCGGMLMVLRSTFEKTRWELLHEAANLLTNCIQLISGST